MSIILTSLMVRLFNDKYSRLFYSGFTITVKLIIKYSYCLACPLSHVVTPDQNSCNLSAGVEPEPFECGEHLVEASGKLIVIDQLLTHLKTTGHKVLLFSQMTRMLDIVQDYLTYRGAIRLLALHIHSFHGLGFAACRSVLRSCILNCISIMTWRVHVRATWWFGTWRGTLLGSSKLQWRRRHVSFSAQHQSR